MKKCVLLGILFLTGINLFAQDEVNKGLSAITESAVKGQLEFLASDWTEGRAAGTKGAYLAADYIASMFEFLGLEPYGDEVRTMPSRTEMIAGVRPTVSKSYFQNFSLVKYTPGAKQSFAVQTTGISSESSVNFGYQTDFYVRTGSVGISAKAPLVFIGYGISDKDKGYDDFKKMDLKGKIAVVLEGFPGHKDTTSVAYKKFHPEGRFAERRFERDKLNKIEKEGALAVIQIRLGEDPSLGWAKNIIYPVHGRYYEADTPLNSYYDYSMDLPDDTLRGSMPVFTVTQRVANSIISGTGVDFCNFEENAKNNLTPASKNIEGKSVVFETMVNSEIVKVRNVVGIIEGEKTDEYIVVGGHYDHLGKFDGWIWNGADDNASGTVGVMTVASAFKATGKKPEKSVIFAAWTAEEKGLYGSEYFVKEAQKEGKNIILNLNYDMIARNTERDTLGNQASMEYTGAYKGIREITEKNIEKYDINLDISYRPSKQPGGGSDHAPFAKVGIPVFYFMAAMHPDYHQPSDEVGKVNWEKMANIIRIGFLNTWEFANSDKYLQIKDPETEEMEK